LQRVSANEVVKALKELANPVLASFQQRYFKTGKGEYGEGDIFLGIKVPQVRAVAKSFRHLELSDIKELAQNTYHEARFAALAILVLQYKAAKQQLTKDQLFTLYLELLKNGVVNNWDLVDATAPYLGVQLLKLQDPVGYLKDLGKGNLWEQRAAIMLTWAFIKAGNLEPTFQMSEHFLTHPHDLIHKACGWMLRESGKKDQQALVEFLNQHKAQMPRVMFRYAIERLPKGLV
jgi:3-methyladenine DNA glycosylase AlkD